MVILRQTAVLACALAMATPLPAQRRNALVESLEHRAGIDSNDAVTHYQLAMAYWDRDRFDDADRSLRRAASLAPQYADAYFALALLPDARGEGYWKKRVKEDGESQVREVFLEAARFYRRAVLLDPLVEVGLLGKARTVSTMIYRTRSGYVLRIAPWYESELVKGINEFRQGKYDRSFERLQKLYDDERAGDDAVHLGEGVLWHHGLAAARLGNYEVATRDFALLTGRAVAREAEAPDDAPPLMANDYRFILATMYFLGGRAEAALRTFQRALEFDIGLYQAHMQIARVHESQGRWPEAIAAWRSAIAVNLDDPSLEIDLGASLARAGMLEEAAEQLELATERNPHDARAPYLLAMVSQQLGRPADARTAFSRFIAIAPSRFAAQLAEARGYLEQGP